MKSSAATAPPSKYGTGKEALLRAAVSVVARKGLRGLTYRSVAEAAGVNNTLVAHHFGTRDALIAAALGWATEQSISASRLREAAALGHSFTETLLDELLAEPELQVFQYEMILEARRRPELSEAVTALYESYVDALAAGLGAAGLTTNVRVVARTLFAALDGLVLQYLAGVDRSAIAASLDEVHDVLLLRIGPGTRP
ncbi:TetR/AcrR family transcriptional regulator [Arthrobacter sp. ISL-69]|uniref:TetR/AcrR family transcriptional regulator n=1 Tax=Arthrobacter sp. ISL-69 TaxID=2819113 RepID=UPI001BE7C717|nr:TetR/AcrR family transcriptional regulator [Arthrobacter sp. ISL-69]MBT2534645.1 TetR family transcriptional regulator [Arthrobacter sp. ISL-69]